ncbi:MAG TPA: flagellar basal body rod protein FlgC, partial [Thalassospira sp.]|nr:flagellar basal body rod protein FlgC [Thalassospira sp.]
NVANADSLATAPGQEPYRRKLLTFKNVMDREVGVEMVKVNKV